MTRLKPRLAGDPASLARVLRDAQGVAGVAAALEVEPRDLTYVLYRAKANYPYRTFAIPKRNGGTRIIKAPHPTVKILQQKLSVLFNELYRPPRGAHGYVNGRSIVTHARRHEHKRWILNLDLEAFFPSINFGRVRGLLIQRYRLSPKAATIVAQLCVDDQELPQGAPTSPVLSNMICITLDRQLHDLAVSHGSWYTRYADDMTISTRQEIFPTDIGYVAEGPGFRTAHVGRAVEAIVTGNGFRINENKVWLRSTYRRQRVTGLTVNRGVNVPREYVRKVRAALHKAETVGLPAVTSAFEENFDHSRKYAGAPIPKYKDVLRGQIEYIGMVRGRNDAIYGGLLSRLAAIQ